MKSEISQLAGIAAFFFLLVSCGGSQNGAESQEHAHHEEEEHHDEHGEKVHLSFTQFEGLEMQVDTLSKRNISSVVKANGELEVPPQNEATVTAILGANISSIQVIEGDEVKRGQVLAYLEHPSLIRLQSDYLEAHNQLQFLEQEFQRQERLYKEEVGSGKTFQQTRSDYRSAQAMVKSLSSQLRQLGVDPQRIQEGAFYNKMPVVSPIDGSIVNVNIKTGQYVQPEKPLFEIVNTHHIHADLMVFEKDIYKVKVGQRVRFTVEMLPDRELFAEIYSVGKKFEQDPKAVHIHAEIENKEGMLIPGMYIKGEILTDSLESWALPEEAIVREGNSHFAFVAEKEEEAWMFTPIPLKAGVSNNGWVAVKFLEEVQGAKVFATNNAYYLLAEMKKGEAGHHH